MPPSKVSSLYAPFPRASVILKGPVHLGDSLFSNWYGWAFLITRSTTWNCRGLSLELFLYSTLLFKASALILASSLTSSSRSKFTFHSLFDSSTTKFWKRIFFGRIAHFSFLIYHFFCTWNFEVLIFFLLFYNTLKNTNPEFQKFPMSKSIAINRNSKHVFRKQRNPNRNKKQN